MKATSTAILADVTTMLQADADHPIHEINVMVTELAHDAVGLIATLDYLKQQRQTFYATNKANIKDAILSLADHPQTLKQALPHLQDICTAPRFCDVSQALLPHPEALLVTLQYMADNKIGLDTYSWLDSVSLMGLFLGDPQKHAQLFHCLSNFNFNDSYGSLVLTAIPILKQHPENFIAILPHLMEINKKRTLYNDANYAVNAALKAFKGQSGQAVRTVIDKLLSYNATPFMHQNKRTDTNQDTTIDVLLVNFKQRPKLLLSLMQRIYKDHPLITYKEEWFHHNYKDTENTIPHITEQLKDSPAALHAVFSTVNPVTAALKAENIKAAIAGLGPSPLTLLPMLDLLKQRQIPLPHDFLLQIINQFNTSPEFIPLLNGIREKELQTPDATLSFDGKALVAHFKKRPKTLEKVLIVHHEMNGPTLSPAIFTEVITTFSAQPRQLSRLLDTLIEHRVSMPDNVINTVISHCSNDQEAMHALIHQLKQGGAQLPSNVIDQAIAKLHAKPEVLSGLFDMLEKTYTIKPDTKHLAAAISQHVYHPEHLIEIVSVMQKHGVEADNTTITAVMEKWRDKTHLHLINPIIDMLCEMGATPDKTNLQDTRRISNHAAIPLLHTLIKHGAVPLKILKRQYCFLDAVTGTMREKYDADSLNNDQRLKRKLILVAAAAMHCITKESPYYAPLREIAIDGNPFLSDEHITLLEDKHDLFKNQQTPEQVANAVQLFGENPVTAFITLFNTHYAAQFRAYDAVNHEVGSVNGCAPDAVTISMKRKMEEVEPLLPDINDIIIGYSYPPPPKKFAVALIRQRALAAQNTAANLPPY